DVKNIMRRGGISGGIDGRMWVIRWKYGGGIFKFCFTWVGGRIMEGRIILIKKGRKGIIKMGVEGR
ncbi:hypothetical protein, partial [Staphylococcus capitis]|uniref:hypothetical protein n=1 Tax=Staphylococcus capitis TaxID=29388 RepID=UPI001C92FBDF